jgi:hypothetical protein
MMVKTKSQLNPGDGSDYLKPSPTPDPVTPEYLSLDETAINRDRPLPPIRQSQPPPRPGRNRHVVVLLVVLVVVVVLLLCGGAYLVWKVMALSADGYTCAGTQPSRGSNPGTSTPSHGKT